MEKIEQIEIDTIEEIPNGDDFKKFLREVGINEVLEDVTLDHTKKRLEVLIALAEAGNDPKLFTNKDNLKHLLNNLKGEKDKRAAMNALKNLYRDYEDNCCSNENSYLEEKELDFKIKKALRQYKKYESFKKHEEKIAQRWIKELTR